MKRRILNAPPVGVYENIPFEDYLAWDAASSSQLKALVRSPAHLKAYRAKPDEDTTALRIGRAAHCATLEPDRFPEQYARLPEGDGRTKVVKDAKEAIEALGRTGLSGKEFECALSIAATLHAHPSAGPLLSGNGRSELSLVWRDEETGVLCKARHDRHSAVFAGGTIVDLKTTVDASLRSFERAIFLFGYHRQGAFYLRGSRALCLPVEHYVLVAVEKEEPFACAVYRLSEAALDAGEQEVVALLKQYRRCTESHVWPGYPTEVRDIALPDWAWGASQHLAESIAE